MKKSNNVNMTVLVEPDNGDVLRSLADQSNLSISAYLRTLAQDAIRNKIIFVSFTVPISLKMTGSNLQNPLGPISELRDDFEKFLSARPRFSHAV